MKSFKEKMEDKDSVLPDDIFSKKDELFYTLYEASNLLNELSDLGFFDKNLTSEERMIVKQAGRHIPNSESQFRSYKTQRLIYTLLKTLEDFGVVKVIEKEDKNNPDEEAKIIFNNYKNKKK